MCFDTGFVIDGFYEECYFNKEIPDIIIVRAKKVSGAFHSLQVQRNQIFSYKQTNPLQKFFKLIDNLSVI